jgi:hypothetical protein
LQCVGAIGEFEIKGRAGTVVVSFENRLHPKAPFGVVTAIWKLVETRDGDVFDRSAIRLTLSDVGTTARSEMPDQN